MTPEVIWLIFIFAFGSCIGSFLNVVIYRLPRGKSLAHPPSACPGCNKGIKFYDNIPLVSFLALGGKCRNCKMKISPRYFCIELLTGLFFIGVFYLYFIASVRRFEIADAAGFDMFTRGGWTFYIVHMVLIASFIAASAIDMELWVIPLSLCWFVTAVGLIGSALAGFAIDPGVIRDYHLLPVATAATSALALGAAIGLAISLLCLAKGIIKISYEGEDDLDDPNQDDNFNHRAEALKEIVFLMPIIICSLISYFLLRKAGFWIEFTQSHIVSGFMGSLWGYFVGCAVVWATRILGTLGFGKEAMGLGDVHLMGAAGAIVGPFFATIAFFIAPFFGIVWAVYQMFFAKTRQIPYGPFLSLGVFVVMIFHDPIMFWWSNMYLYHAN